VECARSRETVKRSALGDAADYGWCSSHSRYFWGFRLHLLAAPDGTPRAVTVASPKRDERDVALELLARTRRHGLVTVIGDKGYAGRQFATDAREMGATILRPNRKDEPGRGPHLAPIRQRRRPKEVRVATERPPRSTTPRSLGGWRQGTSTWPRPWRRADRPHGAYVGARGAGAGRPGNGVQLLGARRLDRHEHWPDDDVRRPWVALSARSNALQEFEGGPGQIALHGRDNFGGYSARLNRTAACVWRPRASTG
jgi:hypothetical protein